MDSVIHLVEERTALDCLETLSLLARPGDEIVCLGPPPPLPPARPMEISRHLPKCRLPACWALRNVAREASVVHAWSLTSAGIALGSLPGRPPRVLLSLPAMPRGPAIKSLARDSVAGRLRLTAPTEVSRRALIACGCAESAVHVLPPPACPVSHRRQRRSGMRKALGVTAKARLVLSPGEMTLHSGHKLAVWACAVLRQIREDVRLLLPVGGPAESSVRNFARAAGHGDELLISRDRFDPADVLAAADVVAFLCSRDCGVTTLAGAMATGLPILASRTPDNVECTDAGRAALLVPPNDPRRASAGLLRLLEEPTLAAELARQAKQKAKSHFSVSASRQRLDEIYQAVAAR